MLDKKLKPRTTVPRRIALDRVEILDDYTVRIHTKPGIGRLMIQAVYATDFPLVQASVTIAALIFVSLNFVVDFIYSYLDPRVRIV